MQWAETKTTAYSERIKYCIIFYILHPIHKDIG